MAGDVFNSLHVFSLGLLAHLAHLALNKRRLVGNEN
jgi:hypothetical protein